MTKTDMKGMKILTVIPNSPKYPHTRVENINTLNFPQKFTDKLSSTIEKHKMYWEVWIESAPNYEELSTRLKKRGYRNFTYSLPLHHFTLEGKISLPPGDAITKTMLRRKF